MQIALPSVAGSKHAEHNPDSPPDEPRKLRIAYQNTDGWRTSSTKRAALGQQFRGEQSVTAQAGYDIASYAEVHCNGRDDVRRYADSVNPYGRSYFTWWLAVCVGPKLNGVPIQATTYGGGRVIRLDMRLAGRPRTYIFVYAPVERAVRPKWFAQFPACMPMTRDLVVVGDFNTRMSRQDHANGASPNPGHQEWASVREAYKTHDVWRRRNPTTQCWSFHGASGRTRIDWLEATEATADEIVSIQYHVPARCCGDHSTIVATQQLRCQEEQPVARMVPEIAMTGSFADDVKSLVRLVAPSFYAAADKNEAWDSLMDDIMELYDDHVAELRRRRHSLLRRLQRKADHAAMRATAAEQADARRTHAELSLELERDALTRDAEQRMQMEEWGDRPTRRFFQQAQVAHRTTTIRKLYRYRPGATPAAKGAVDRSTVDTQPGEIARSLSNFWQDVFRDTTGPDTPYRRLAEEYPEHMCVRPDDHDAVGGKFTVAEVTQGIQGLATRKSTEGVVAEVFKAAASELAPLLTAQLNYAHDVGRLSTGQRYGRISLLFKSGDPADPRQYRPVAVLRADFKIAALVLTARLSPHLPRIAAKTQTGFIKGRYIHENCLRLRDAMHYVTTDAAARLNPTCAPTHEHGRPTPPGVEWR